MVLGLLCGCAIGFLVGIGAAVVFNDISWSEAIHKVFSGNLSHSLIPVLWGMLWLLVSMLLQVTIHEGGHLVAGLLTGYRFVSFRVLEFTLIKKDGRYQWRRYALASTGGQCLMAPPQRPLQDIDTRWYNAGGVLANIIVSTIALLLLIYVDMPVWAETFMLMIAFIGYMLALVNGIPMKIGGINNDGRNLLFLEKSPEDKRILCQMLEANACIQEGVQPKDLPEAMFPQKEGIDWHDALQTNWQLMAITRMVNQHHWEDAYARIHEAMAEKKHIIKLFQLELTLEQIFVCLATGRKDEAHECYNKEMRKYVSQFKKTHSSKQRIHFAATLLLDDKRDEAEAILNKVKEHRQDYVLQGEVDMDIELMEWMLENSATR